jgi:hypothetical protein
LNDKIQHPPIVLCKRCGLPMVMHYKKNGASEWRCRRYLLNHSYPTNAAQQEDYDAWPEYEPPALLEDDLFDLIESDFSNMEDNK